MASRKPIAQSLVSGFSAYIDPEVHPTAFLFHGPLRTTPGSLHHSDTFPCMPNKPQGLVVSQRQPAAPVSDPIPVEKSNSEIVPINIVCPNCTKILRMRAEKFHGNIGKRIKCPTCNKGMTLSMDLLSK